MISMRYPLATIKTLCLMLGLTGITLFNLGYAQNSIDAIEVTTQSGNTTLLKITLKELPTATPGSFAITNPPRIAFDFPNTTNNNIKNLRDLVGGDIQRINIVEADNRSRIVLDTARPLAYDTKVNGRIVLVTLRPNLTSSPDIASTNVTSFAPNNIKPTTPALLDVDFRRGLGGEGRVIVDLSDNQIGIDVRKQGRQLIVDFMNASLPKNLQRRLNVVDFGTPIDTLETTANGENTRMVIAPRGNWDHVAYQTGNQFILEVRKISDDSTQLVAGGNAGEKLTLNFQNIEVRALLQVLADFTGLNLITSDTVTGTVTLRLKDVPWDQALDIILQSKNLDFRKNGNVLMVGLRDELASRERLKLESKEQSADFEPLVTETVQLNYITSAVANTIINDPKAKLLSRRGSAISDARNNIIFLQDTNARVQELKRILKASDIPVRQVMIESRIVEASNQFNKNLGVRLTAGKISNTPNSWAVGGNYATTQYRTGRIPDKPTSADETFFDAPAPGVGGASAAKIAAMLISPRYGALLGLEISALQFDGKGRTISSPRVITSDKTEAVIEQGTEIPYQQATASGATAISFKKATLSLRVKPQITPNDDVIMTLKVNKDSIGVQTTAGPSVDTKQVSTEVLVENGGTVVIGGVFTQDENDSQAKVPMLGDLPGVGVLFRNNIKSETRKELLVFITPKIMRNNAFQR